MKDFRDLARTISMMAPGSSVKLDVLHKGETKPVTLTLAEMPNERHANAGEAQPTVSEGAPISASG